jgi:hypothetical protein
MEGSPLPLFRYYCDGILDFGINTTLHRVLSAGLHDLTFLNLLLSAFAPIRARRTDGSHTKSKFTR